MDEDLTKDKYDIEFIGLMKEVTARMKLVNKSNTLKINSWIKCLIIPSKRVEWKKNRNLYLIKLIDNLINDTLTEPFNKFAPDNARDIKTLYPEVVKSQLSQNFFNEINYLRVEQGELSNPSQEDNYDSPVGERDDNRIDRGANSTSKKNRSLSPNNKYENSLSATKNISGSLSMDKFKLESMLNVLRQKNSLRDQVIEGQLREINELKSKVNSLEKKAKLVLSYQLQKNQKDKDA